MKKIYIMLFLSLLGFCATAQTLVGTAGGEQQSASANLSFSIGEPVITTLEGSVILTQGFQQVDNIIISVEELESHLVSLYPNPCSNDLFLSIESPGEYAVEIINMQGLVVLNQEAPFQKTSHLDVSPLKSGMYVLRIRNLENGQLKSLKFQKTG